MNYDKHLIHYTGVSPKSNGTKKDTHETTSHSHSLGHLTFKEKKNSNSINHSSPSQLGIYCN